MRATRAAKIGARAGRLTRLVKLTPGKEAKWARDESVTVEIVLHGGFGSSTVPQFCRLGGVLSYIRLYK